MSILYEIQEAFESLQEVMDSVDRRYAASCVGDLYKERNIQPRSEKDLNREVKYAEGCLDDIEKSLDYLDFDDPEEVKSSVDEVLSQVGNLRSYLDTIRGEAESNIEVIDELEVSFDDIATEMGIDLDKLKDCIGDLLHRLPEIIKMLQEPKYTKLQALINNSEYIYNYRSQKK